MSWTVKKLSREAGWEDPEAAALALMEAGFDSVTGVKSHLDVHEAKRAREHLRELRRPAPNHGLAPSTPRDYPAPQWPDAVRNQRLAISYLDVESVIHIHEALELEFRGTPDAVEPPGIKDEGSLRSAVGRSQMAPDQYHSVPLAAAALVHGLVLNHPFHNGNKRTALLSLAIFLEERNGWYLKDEAQDELYDIVVATASHRIVPLEVSDGSPADRFYADREVLTICSRLQSMTQKPRSGNENLQWRRLRAILERLGCEVDPIRNNKTKIRRVVDGRVLQAPAGARNDGDEIDGPFIGQLRRQLELTEEHGFDYAVFYEGKDQHPPLPEVITRYRRVLERLAELDRSD